MCVRVDDEQKCAVVRDWRTHGRPGTTVACKRPRALKVSNLYSSYRHIKIFT